MKKYCLYNSNEIIELDIEQFDQWLDFICHNPTKFAKSYKDPSANNYPSDFWLYERWPYSGNNSRHAENNLREEYEKKLIKAISHNNQNDEIHLLNLCSDGLFQDLIILLKLHAQGYKNISLDCLANIDNSEQQILLTSIATRLNQSGANIKIQHFKTQEFRFNWILRDKTYDAIYGIDFAEISRVLNYDEELFSDRYSSNNEITTILINALAKLKSKPMALFLITADSYYLALENQTNELQPTNIVNFEYLIDSNTHDYYQIKTSIFALIMYLPYLKQQNKPILLNQALVLPYQTALKQILNQHGISYELYIVKEEDLQGVFIRYNLPPQLVSAREENLKIILEQNNIKLPFVTENEFAKRLKAESATSLILDAKPFTKKEYALHNSIQIMELAPERFDQWLQLIYLSPTKSENGLSRAHQFPSSSWLHECWCINQENSRHSKINLREKYENRIIDAISSHDKKDDIHLLSLGSGGLFQDLMILLRLHADGYKNLSLDCVDISNNSNQQNLLAAIVIRLNQKGSNIRVRHFKHLDQIKEGQFYNCIYAIDFDEAVKISNIDGSSRQLKHRASNLKTGELTALFIKAYAKLAPTPTALFLMTVGKDYLALQNEIKSSSFLNFENVIENNSYHDYYYINANIFELLNHLPFLRKQDKPLLINEALIDPQIMESLIQILNTQGLTYEIASENSIAKKLDKELATVLIIDDTAFDNSYKNESWIDKQFNHGCAQMARWNCNLGRKTDSYIIAPPFIDIKGVQLSKKITQMTTLDFLTKVMAGIECYQQSRSNSSLPSCSLWSNRQAETRIAKKLKYQMESLLSEPKILLTAMVNQDLKNKLYTELNSTSSSKNSLSRIIYASLLNDKQLQQISDDDFQKLKLYLIVSGNPPLLQYKTPKPEKNAVDNGLRDSILEESMPFRFC
ncbi:MAG: hypothetical protein H0T84_04745 [Tatlockia sp.]|nr:hypothetical protein [Tatlockia sp.]